MRYLKKSYNSFIYNKSDLKNNNKELVIPYFVNMNISGTERLMYYDRILIKPSSKNISSSSNQYYFKTGIESFIMYLLNKENYSGNRLNKKNQGILTKKQGEVTKGLQSTNDEDEIINYLEDSYDHDQIVTFDIEKYFPNLKEFHISNIYKGNINYPYDESSRVTNDHESDIQNWARFSLPNDVKQCSGNKNPLAEGNSNKGLRHCNITPTIGNIFYAYYNRYIPKKQKYSSNEVLSYRSWEHIIPNGYGKFIKNNNHHHYESTYIKYKHYSYNNLYIGTEEFLIPKTVCTFKSKTKVYKDIEVSYTKNFNIISMCEYSGSNIDNLIGSIQYIHFFACINSSIKKIKIKDVILIQSRAFWRCKQLKYTEIRFININSVSDNIQNQKPYTIPIECFANCVQLKTVKIYGSVCIKKHAFSNCNNLENVYIYANGKEELKISYQAFYNCPRLKNIYIYNYNHVSYSKSILDGDNVVYQNYLLENNNYQKEKFKLIMNPPEFNGKEYDWISRLKKLFYNCFTGNKREINMYLINCNNAVDIENGIDDYNSIIFDEIFSSSEASYNMFLTKYECLNPNNANLYHYANTDVKNFGKINFIEK